MEFPIEFFLDAGPEPEAAWPARTKLRSLPACGLRANSGRACRGDRRLIAEIHTKYNARRKPELLYRAHSAFTITGEAETDRRGLDDLLAEPKRQSCRLPGRSRCIFRTGALPGQRLRKCNELYIAVARNNLYAEEGRASTNDMGRTGARVIPGRCRSGPQSITTSWPRQMGSHDGSDAHRLHLLAATGEEQHAEGERNRCPAESRTRWDC